MADLDSVISNAIAGAESASGTETATETPAAAESATPETEGAETVEAAAETPAEPVAETPAEGETPAEVATPAVPAKKQGPIPFDRHQKILENARAAAAKEVEDLKARLAPFESEDAQAFTAAMRMADEDPATFAKVLLSDAKVGAELRKAFAAEGAAPAAPADSATKPAATPAGPSEKPGPDILLEDGRAVYSSAQLEKLMEWQSQQTADALTKRFEEKLKTEYGEVPEIVAERKAQIAFQRAVSTQKPILEEARRTLPRFTEFENEMRDFIVKTPGATLEKAYLAVVVPKLQQSEQQVREKVIAEMNGRPAAVVPKKTPAAPKVVAQSGDLESVIARSIANAGIGE